jgi:hypothetical protein
LRFIRFLLQDEQQHTIQHDGERLQASNRRENPAEVYDIRADNDHEVFVHI